jgi:hypothetical protein
MRQSVSHNIIIKINTILLPQSLNNMYYTTNKTYNPLMMLSYFNFQSYRILQRCLLSFVLLLSLCMSSSAQQKGIDGNLQILSPYPVYISDFTSLTTDRLKLMVRSNEFMNSGTTDYRLRIVLEKGNSIIAQSDVAANLTGVSNFKLLANVPYNFTTAELAPYFRLENLTGINEANYNEPLTEGVYRLSFFVYGAKSLSGPWTLMSDAISQQFWVVQNDPPLLNIPTNGDVIQTEAAAMINFQWIPRAIQTATRHEYEFTLVEIGKENADNPYVVFKNNVSKPTAFKRMVSVPALSISATELGLENDKTYGWRVRVKSLGVDSKEVINYKNEGYSDIFVFSYKRICPKPTGLALEVKSSDLVFANWNTNPKHFSYRVAYRKYSPTESFRWLEQEVNTNATKLSQLEPNTEYEVMVGGLCGENFLNYCDPIRVKTLAKDTIKDVICGVFNRPELANTTPIASLKVTDIITAGDFPITITKISGSNGVFTGEGFVASPWLGFVPFKVNFNNITVNTNKQLVRGFIETAYDPTWKNILNIDGYIEGGNDVGTVKNGIVVAEFDIDFPITDANNFEVILNEQTGGATIFVKNSSGQSQTLDVKDLPTTVKDSEGRVYAIDNQGKATLVGQQSSLAMSSDELNALSPSKGRVDFLKAGFYAFDAYREVYQNDVLWKSKYEKIDNYGVAQKAIAPGKPDVVKAKVISIDVAFNPDSIKFMSAKGMAYKSRSLGNGEYEVNVVGGSAGDGQEIYALYPKLTEKDKYWSLGKISVFAYKPITKKVVVVPVENAIPNIEIIKKELNTIYNPVCVTWEVEKAATFNNSTWDVTGNGLDVDGSGLFSAYTDEMKSLNQKYQATNKGNIFNDAVYIFAIEKASDASVLGDMPRGKQFGYLFTNNNDEQGKVVGHEIGHGFFKLKHIDDGYYLPIDSFTNNLMVKGRELSKYQWDIIHDPGIAFSLFDSDDDSYYQKLTLSTLALNNNFSENTTCVGAPTSIGLTPDGYPIKTGSTPSDVINIQTFNTNGAGNYVVSGFVRKIGAEVVKYSATFKDGRFDGYKLNGDVNSNTTLNYDTYKEPKQKVIVKVYEYFSQVQYREGEICWEVPQSPLRTKDVSALVDIQNKDKNIEWVFKTFPNAKYTSSFVTDFGTKNGLFYSITNDVDSTETKKLIANINALVGDLMTDTDYLNFLKIPMQATGKKFLTKAELQDMYESLELIKSLRGLFGVAAKFEEIINWIKNCNAVNSDVCTIGNNLVPRCLWDNDLSSIPLSPTASLPTMAGVIDGAYQTIEGLAELGVLAAKFQIGSLKFLNCWVNPLEFSKFGSDPNCQETRKETIEAVDYVKRFATDPATRNSAYETFKDLKDAIGTQFDQWWDETFCIGSSNEQFRCCQYNQGRLVFDVASCFFGVGELKLAAKGGNVFGAIGNQLAKMNLLLSNLKKTSWLKMSLIKAAQASKRTVTTISISAVLSTGAISLCEVTQATAKVVVNVIKTVPQNATAEISQAIRLTPKVTSTLTKEAASELTELATKSEISLIENVVLEATDDVAGLVQKGGAGSYGFVKITKAGTESVAIVAKDNLGKIQVIAQATVGTSGGVIINFIKAEGENEPSNTCTFCRKNNVTLCKKLESLSKLDPIGRTVTPTLKLCNSNLTDPALEGIADKLLNSFTRTQAIDFLTDLTPSTPSEHIGANINSLAREIVEAWKLVYDAKTNDFKETYRYDMELLKQVADILHTNNSTVLVALGGEAGLKEILQKHYTAPCYTCRIKRAYQSNMSDFLKDVVYFVKTYSSSMSNNSIAVLTGTGLKSGSAWQTRATAFMLKVIKNVPRNGFTKFEEKIPKSGDLNGCVPDAREDKKIVEFKSWAKYTATTNEANAGNEEDEDNDTKADKNKPPFQNLAEKLYPVGVSQANSYTQFRCYINQIDRIEDLEYIFDNRRNTVDEAYVKGVFKDLLFQAATPGDPNKPDRLTAHGEEIFGIIWNRATLRTNLFPDDSTDDKKDSAKSKFVNMVSNTANTFYKFINVK